MTMGDDRLEELGARGTAAVLTKRQRVERWVLYVVGSITVILVIGYFANKQATSNVADCTNQNLATRNAPAQADAQAHIDYAVAQSRWVTAINTVITDVSGSPQQSKDFTTLLVISEAYQKAGDTYVATLQADNQQRLANPLGKC